MHHINKAQEKKTFSALLVNFKTEFSKKESVKGSYLCFILKVNCFSFNTTQNKTIDNTESSTSFASFSILNLSERRFNTLRTSTDLLLQNSVTGRVDSLISHLFVLILHSRIFMSEWKKFQSSNFHLNK